MSNITKREFSTLDITGSNYLTWAFDVKIHLTSLDLSRAIVENSNCTAAQKAKALIFIRHHLHEDLKTEYLTEEDPYVLWQSLKDRYDHQQQVVLPQAQFEWINLRFQDFKSVAEYNSAIHRIVSQMRLCGQEITENEMLEKTLSTFHASSLVLQQQYRAKNYTKHSELISALLVAEKHNQLLMHNHNARPTGSAPVHEAHITKYSGRKHFGKWKTKGRKMKYQPKQRFDKRSNGSRGGPQKKTGPAVPSEDDRDTCRRCGGGGHWSRTCRTPIHLVELYQKDKAEKKKEAHFVNPPAVEHEGPSIENTALDYDHFNDLA